MADVYAFFAAIAAGDAEKVRTLLDETPDLVHEPAGDGASAALTALYNRNPALADELAARSGALSPWEAAAFDDTGRLEDLIRESIDVVVGWSADGWQPLHLAAFFGRVESARILLDADAPVDEYSRNRIAVQPLHAATSGGHSEIVWLLIASGADVNATQQLGYVPLHAAAHNGDVESVRALLSAGADPTVANDEGNTPADLAANDEVRALLEGAP